MKYSNIKYFCTVNGNGIRTCIQVSGCKFHCKGCFNEIAWNFNFGLDVTEEVIDRILDSIDCEYCEGLSILGGEPLVEENLEGVNHIIERFRERFGKNKDIWIWTGYYVSEFSNEQKEVALKCDYIVDGRFVADKALKHYRFKGSENQTIWKSDGNEFVLSEYNN